MGEVTTGLWNSHASAMCEGGTPRLPALGPQGHEPGGQQVLGHSQAGCDPQLSIPGPAEAGDAGVELVGLG